MKKLKNAIKTKKGLCLFIYLHSHYVWHIIFLFTSITITYLALQRFELPYFISANSIPQIVCVLSVCLAL